MARSKGSKRALVPLNQRDPGRFELIKQNIKGLGPEEVASYAGLSKESIRLFLKGDHGISENAERSILRGISEAKKAKQKVDEDLKKVALDVLTT